MSATTPGAAVARYRYLRDLGRGGMGEVVLVHDAVRGEDVALKRILDLDTESLVRFKREFRVVADLLHPNLVRLHDLDEDEQGPFFTMEAIDGADPGDYCTRSLSSLRDGVSGDSSGVRTATPTSAAATDRDAPTLGVAELAEAPTVAGDSVPGASVVRPSLRPPPAVSIEALLHVAPQLVEALAFLHGHGIVHRDLKPSNVMVRRDGVAKLLDFGILATAADRRHDRGQLVGTVGFMSPEQLRGDAPEPTTDLYALGATLFVLITGRPVFDASTLEATIVAHQELDAPRLDSVTDGLPEPLVDLVAKLLERDPSRRAGLDEVADMLEAAGARRAIVAAPRGAAVRLVGRDDLLEQSLDACERALHGDGAAVVLRGPSGSGKTAIAERLATELGRRGVLVLRGRGRGNERVAFNALDAIVDEVALALVRTRKLSRSTRKSAERAATAFPVLGRGGPPRRTSSRLEALRALRRLLAELAPEAGILLLVDDLQWADEDSLRALQELTGAGVAVLATQRDDLPAGLAEAWATEFEAIVLDVERLREDALEAIVRDAAERAGVDQPSERAVRTAVELSAGKPLLAEVAGRALATGDSGDPLGALVNEATRAAPELLAALVAADDWTSVATLAVHVGRSVGDVLDSVQALAAAGVLSRTGVGGRSELVDVYHDALRGGLRHGLGDRIATAHGRFADLASGGELPGVPAVKVVGHLLSAGRRAEAAERADAAAQNASEKLAYGLEADMLAIALEHGDDDDESRSSLLRRRAEALEKVARYSDAASCWDEVARIGPPAAKREASIRAANALLGANRVEEGAARLSDALEAGRDGALGKHGWRDVVGVVRFFGGPRRGSTGHRDDPELRQHAEADVRLGLMLGFFDPLKGLRVIERARDAFHGLGDQTRLAWCDLLLACFADFGHAGEDESRLSRRYRDAADARCEAHGIDTPELRAVRGYLRSTAAIRRGDWEGALAAAAEAIELLEKAGKRGVFEYTYALTTFGTVAYVRQDVRGIRDTARRFRAIQRDGGDLTLATHAAVMEVAVAVFEGRFDAARTAVADAEAALPETHWTIQRAVVGYTGCLPEIYDGDPRKALTRAIEADPVAQRFRLFETHVGAIHATLAGLSEVLALRLGDGRFSRRRLRARLRVVEKAGPVTAGVSERLRAYCEDARGRPDRARDLLTRARRAAADADRPVDAAIATYQLGLRTSGVESESLKDDARAAMASAGAHEALLFEDPTLR